MNPNRPPFPPHGHPQGPPRNLPPWERNFPPHHDFPGQPPFQGPPPPHFHHPPPDFRIPPNEPPRGNFPPWLAQQPPPPHYEREHFRPLGPPGPHGPPPPPFDPRDSRDRFYPGPPPPPFLGHGPPPPPHMAPHHGHPPPPPPPHFGPNRNAPPPRMEPNRGSAPSADQSAPPHVSDEVSAIFAQVETEIVKETNGKEQGPQQTAAEGKQAPSDSDADQPVPPPPPSVPPPPPEDPETIMVVTKSGVRSVQPSGSSATSRTPASNRPKRGRLSGSALAKIGKFQLQKNPLSALRADRKELLDKLEASEKLRDELNEKREELAAQINVKQALANEKFANWKVEEKKLRKIHDKYKKEHDRLTAKASEGSWERPLDVSKALTKIEQDLARAQKETAECNEKVNKATRDFEAAEESLKVAEKEYQTVAQRVHALEAQVSSTRRKMLSVAMTDQSARAALTELLASLVADQESALEEAKQAEEQKNEILTKHNDLRNAKAALLDSASDADQRLIVTGIFRDMLQRQQMISLNGQNTESSIQVAHQQRTILLGTELDRVRKSLAAIDKDRSAFELSELDKLDRSRKEKAELDDRILRLEIEEKAGTANLREMADKERELLIKDGQEAPPPLEDSAEEEQAREEITKSAIPEAPPALVIPPGSMLLPPPQPNKPLLPFPPGFAPQRPPLMNPALLGPSKTRWGSGPSVMIPIMPQQGGNGMWAHVPAGNGLSMPPRNDAPVWTDIPAGAPSVPSQDAPIPSKAPESEAPVWVDVSDSSTFPTEQSDAPVWADIPSAPQSDVVWETVEDALVIPSSTHYDPSSALQEEPVLEVAPERAAAPKRPAESENKPESQKKPRRSIAFGGF